MRENIKKGLSFSLVEILANQELKLEKSSFGQSEFRNVKIKIQMQFSKSLLNAFLLAQAEIVRQPRAATREIEHDRRYSQLKVTNQRPEFRIF